MNKGLQRLKDFPLLTEEEAKRDMLRMLKAKTMIRKLRGRNDRVGGQFEAYTALLSRETIEEEGYSNVYSVSHNVFNHKSYHLNPINKHIKNSKVDVAVTYEKKRFLGLPCKNPLIHIECKMNSWLHYFSPKQCLTHIISRFANTPPNTKRILHAKNIILTPKAKQKLHNHNITITTNKHELKKTITNILKHHKNKCKHQTKKHILHRPLKSNIPYTSTKPCLCTETVSGKPISNILNSHKGEQT